MKLKIFAIYDSQAEIYLRPIVETHAAIVLRSLADEMNRPDGQSTLGNHARDFTLYQIGAFDQESGELEKQTHEKIIDLNLLKETNNVQK